ncbi:hypothetical protein R3P38DRAFT_3219136 [Favolaschia claudopus]|uniref:F-box domain-containing protein n=1 Tax=Favolaschia claudopus TaxID=2862362 RepID=A0AAW0A270_9AGAR
MIDLGQEHERLDWHTIAHLHYVKVLCSFKKGYNEPIGSLPEEILRDIFALTPDPFDSAPEKWLSTCQRLRSVCSVWRTIVNSSPYLFTKILVDEKAHPDLLRRWLALSGTMKLCVFFSLGPDGDESTKSHFVQKNLVSVIAPYMSRCNKVFLRGHTYNSAQVLFSAMEDFDGGSVRVVNVAAGPGPHITKLPDVFASSTSGVQRIVAERCALFNLPSSLTSLELANITPGRCVTSPEFCAALLHAPNLEQLVVIYVTILYLDRPRTELPSLTSLVICCSTSQEAGLLQAIDLPNLQKLKVHTDEPDIFADFIDMLSHGPHVACVSLSIYTASLTQMRGFFLLLPELRSLHTQGSDEDLETILVDLIMRWPAMFPYLEQLRFGEELEPDILTDLFHTLASVSPRVNIVSPICDAKEGHRRVQTMLLKDGIISTEDRLIYCGHVREIDE